MQVKKERIFYYDFLRAFAIITVIMCHVGFFFGPLNTPIEVIIRSTFRNIGILGVPIFLMISGALLLNRDYGLADFLKRRFARIVYPFIFWITLIILQIIYLNGSYALIWNTFIGNPSITWYFWILIGIYLFIPVINAFIEKYGERGCEYFLVIWFFTIILQTFNSYPLFPDFNLDYFAKYIGYPVLGYYLNNKAFNLNDKKMCISGLAVFIISLVTLIYLDYNNLNFMPETYLNIVIVLMGAGLYLFIRYLDNMTSFKHIKNNIIGKIIISLSLCSYGMYFSHVIVIKILADYNPQSNLLFPAMFALTIFLSWILPYVFSKIPYIKKVSGV